MTFRSIFCCGNGLDRKDPQKNLSTWRVFSLKELHAATNNFNYDNKLGEGGFGSVYWGQLWDGSQIAVKRLRTWNSNAETEFGAELEVLGKVKHKNLLSLRGYCVEGQERLIVYEYMPNLSILSHLHGHHSTECLLDWKKRMAIAMGSAEGIAHLHHHAVPPIIHRDIKASNVLLDSNFVPQVADFGFAKLIPEGVTHVTTRVKGSAGYVAPEYVTLGRATESCDVYSFGIFLLEVGSGKKPIERVDTVSKIWIREWALPLAKEGKFREVADPKLNGDYDEEELKRVILVGLGCAQNEPDQRPTMLEVVDLLKVGAKDKIADLEKQLFKPPLSTALENDVLET